MGTDKVVTVSGITISGADAGNYQLAWTSASTTANITPAAVVDVSASATASATEQASMGDLVLATFTDPDTDGTTADYSGTIHWGDGQASPFRSSAVQLNGDGSFSVHGSHTYAEEGSYAVTVDVRTATAASWWERAP